MEQSFLNVGITYMIYQLLLVRNVTIISWLSQRCRPVLLNPGGCLGHQQNSSNRVKNINQCLFKSLVLWFAIGHETLISTSLLNKKQKQELGWEL